MSTGKPATFTAGLVQMRSGLSPSANLDAAVRLIEEAKSDGEPARSAPTGQEATPRTRSEVGTLVDKAFSKRIPPETTSWEYPFADRSWHDEFAEFVAAIAERRQPVGNIHDAIAALEIVGAVYERA